MSKLRYSLAGALIAVGCANETFNLMSEGGRQASEGGKGGEVNDAQGGRAGAGSPAGGTGGAGQTFSGGNAGFGVGGSTGGGQTGGAAGSFAPCTGDECIPPCLEGPCVSCAEGPEACYPVKSAQRCHPHWKRCVACWIDEHCPPGFSCNALTGACDPQCSQVKPCEDPLRPLCFDGHCLECIGSHDCHDDERPVCRGATCWPCRGDHECGAYEYCEFGSCKDGRRPNPSMPDGGAPMSEGGAAGVPSDGGMAGAGG